MRDREHGADTTEHRKVLNAVGERAQEGQPLAALERAGDLTHGTLKIDQSTLADECGVREDSALERAGKVTQDTVIVNQALLASQLGAGKQVAGALVLENIVGKVSNKRDRLQSVGNTADKASFVTEDRELGKTPDRDSTGLLSSEHDSNRHEKAGDTHLGDDSSWWL